MTKCNRNTVGIVSVAMCVGFLWYVSSCHYLSIHCNLCEWLASQSQISCIFSFIHST